MISIVMADSAPTRFGVICVSLGSLLQQMLLMLKRVLLSTYLVLFSVSRTPRRRFYATFFSLFFNVACVAVSRPRFFLLFRSQSAWSILVRHRKFSPFDVFSPGASTSRGIFVGIF